MHHDLPTEAGAAGDLARQLARLVGPAIQAGDSTVAAQEYLALGGALADARQTTLAAIAEALPQTALHTLSAWEAMLRIPVRPGAAPADRRAVIVARLQASGGTPSRIELAASTFAGGACGVYEVAWSSLAAGFERYVFRFVIGIPVALVDDEAFRAALDELLERVSPAHTTWSVVRTGALLFDVDGSGFDGGLLT